MVAGGSLMASAEPGPVYPPTWTLVVMLLLDFLLSASFIRVRAATRKRQSDSDS